MFRKGVIIFILFLKSSSSISDSLIGFKKQLTSYLKTHSSLTLRRSCLFLPYPCELVDVFYGFSTSMHSWRWATWLASWTCTSVCTWQEMCSSRFLSDNPRIWNLLHDQQCRSHPAKLGPCPHPKYQGITTSGWHVHWSSCSGMDCRGWQENIPVISSWVWLAGNAAFLGSRPCISLCTCQ